MKKMLFSLTVSVMLFSNITNAATNPKNTQSSLTESNPNLQWTNQNGVKNPATDSFGNQTYGMATSADNMGNVYITGSSNVPLTTKPQIGYDDYYISRYDSTGKLIWTIQNGAPDAAVMTQGIKVDNLGNIYVVGSTNRSLGNEPQTGGTDDYFIAKYNNSGILQWLHQVGGYTSKSKYQQYANTNASGVTVDSQGYIYVSGYTSVGISGNQKIGSMDYFVAKYNTNGDLIWTKEIGVANGSSTAYGISAGNKGAVYVVGYTSASLSNQPQTGVDDYFISKLDSGTGNLIWSTQAGAPGGTSLGYGISSDSHDNIYVSGWTNQALGTNIQTGKHDYFIAKYDTNANLQWVKQVGGYVKPDKGGVTQASGVSLVDDNSIYIAGWTTAGISNQQLIGHKDYFIAKYDALGNLFWSHEIGGKYPSNNEGGDTWSMGISANSLGKIYTVGTTDVSITSQGQNGQYDYFIAQYTN